MSGMGFWDIIKSREALKEEIDKLRSALNAANPPKIVTDEDELERMDLLHQLNEAKAYITRLETIEKKLPQILVGLVDDIMDEISAVFDEARTHERKVIVVKKQQETPPPLMDRPSVYLQSDNSTLPPDTTFTSSEGS